MKIASIQLGFPEGESSSDREERVEQILRRMEEEEQRPDLILLPELWQCGFFSFEAYRKHGERADGASAVWMRNWAKRLHCMIHMGSFVERRDEREGEENCRYSNTSLLFGRDGEILARYRKIHLFGYESEERRILTPGRQTAAVQTEFGGIGLATCYDLRFPEQFRRMTEQGAEIFLVTSAWPARRLEHWRLFNRVRALENQAFLISCNCGWTDGGVPYAGHSMCVGPDGTVLAEAGAEPEVLYAEIAPEQAGQYRAAFPALADAVKLPGTSEKKTYS